MHGVTCGDGSRHRLHQHSSYMPPHPPSHPTRTLVGSCPACLSLNSAPAPSTQPACPAARLHLKPQTLIPAPGSPPPPTRSSPPPLSGTGCVLAGSASSAGSPWTMGPPPTMGLSRGWLPPWRAWPGCRGAQTRACACGTPCTSGERLGGLYWIRGPAQQAEGPVVCGSSISGGSPGLVLACWPQAVHGWTACTAGDQLRRLHWWPGCN